MMKNLIVREINQAPDGRWVVVSDRNITIDLGCEPPVLEIGDQLAIDDLNALGIKPVGFIIVWLRMKRWGYLLVPAEKITST